MKVKQIVEAKFHHVYLGWNNLSFTDVNENEVKVEITDDQILALSDKLLAKATQIIGADRRNRLHLGIVVDPRDL